jgi:hypothetical protein
MSGFELVAGVIAFFFIAGVAMGVLLGVVLPWLRGRRQGYLDEGDWREPPAPEEGEERPAWWYSPRD